MAVDTQHLHPAVLADTPTLCRGGPDVFCERETAVIAHYFFYVYLYKDNSFLFLLRWSYSVRVITQDFESCDLGSNPGRTSLSLYLF